MTDESAIRSICLDGIQIENDEDLKECLEFFEIFGTTWNSGLKATEKPRDDLPAYPFYIYLGVWGHLIHGKDPHEDCTPIAWSQLKKFAVEEEIGDD